MEKQKNIPALRFPEFGGEWVEKRLGEISKITTGKLDANAMVKDGEYRFYTCAKDYFRIDRWAFDTEALLVSGNGANVGYIHYYKGKFNAYQRTYVLDGFFDEIIYVKYFLDHFLSRRIDGEKKEGNTPYIVLSTLSEMDLRLPEIREQKKIANFLTAIDEKLQALKKKKALLEQYKKGVMQKIFSQELRFKDENGNDFADWEVKKLGDVGIFFSGGTPLTTKRKYFNGEIPFIRSGEINSDKTLQFITEEGLKNSSAKMVEAGDLLYALYGATSGEVAISKIKGAINQAILCIRSNLNNKFLYNYLLLEKENIIKTYLQGGQGNLSAEIIKSLKVSVPSISEQQKIANFLTTIDTKINQQQSQIEKVSYYKKGLLQQMFC